MSSVSVAEKGYKQYNWGALDPVTHRQLKILATARGQTVSGYVESILKGIVKVGWPAFIGKEAAALLAAGIELGISKPDDSKSCDHV